MSTTYTPVRNEYVVSVSQLYSSLYQEMRVWSEEYTCDWDEFRFNDTAPDLIPMVVEYLLDNYRPTYAYDTASLFTLIRCYLPNLRPCYVMDMLGKCIGHVLDKLGIYRDARYNLYIHREGDVLRYFTVMEQSDDYH